MFSDEVTARTEEWVGRNGFPATYAGLMKMAEEEGWDVAVHDCSNRTKFARGLNLSGKEGKWFGASNYGSEFTRPPFEAFLPILQDESFTFLEEEELPEGYRPGELFF